MWLECPPQDSKRLIMQNVIIAWTLREAAKSLYFNSGAIKALPPPPPSSLTAAETSTWENSYIFLNSTAFNTPLMVIKKYFFCGFPTREHHWHSHISTVLPGSVVRFSTPPPVVRYLTVCFITLDVLILNLTSHLWTLYAQ